MSEQETNANAMVEQYGPAPELDLSLINKSNLEANKSKGNSLKAVEKKVAEASLKERKSKFCFTEEHEVELPSRGYLYQDSVDEDIKKGIVRLRPMSLADEEIIANQSYIKNGTVFAHLLNSCILNNFDARDFIPYDVFYLLYALRQITYGEDYKFEITCPECEKKYEYEMKMNEISFNELNGQVESIKKFKLPVSKFTIEMRCSRLGDEETVYKMGKMQEYADCSETVLTFIAKTLEIFDTKGQPVDKKDYADFFYELPGKDRAEITKQFEEIDGLEIPSVTCTCPKCSHEKEMTIPFTKGFFRY